MNRVLLLSLSLFFLVFHLFLLSSTSCSIDRSMSFAFNYYTWFSNQNMMMMSHRFYFTDALTSDRPFKDNWPSFDAGSFVFRSTAAVRCQFLDSTLQRVPCFDCTNGALPIKTNERLLHPYRRLNFFVCLFVLFAVRRIMRVDDDWSPKTGLTVASTTQSLARSLSA